MAPERGVDHETWGDLESSVDDFRLAVHDLAFDFRDRLRRVPADRGPRTGLRRRPYLVFSDRVNRIHRADVPAVELGRIVEEEVDLIELLLLDVENSVRERVELAGVVPVTVSNNDPGDGSGIQPDVFHLVGQVPPAARGVPIENIRQLLPAAVVKRDLTIRPFDDSDIHWKVNERDIVPGVRTAGYKRPVRHKSVE